MARVGSSCKRPTAERKSMELRNGATNCRVADKDPMRDVSLRASLVVSDSRPDRKSSDVSWRRYEARRLREERRPAWDGSTRRGDRRRCPMGEWAVESPSRSIAVIIEKYGRMETVESRGGSATGKKKRGTRRAGREKTAAATAGASSLLSESLKDRTKSTLAWSNRRPFHV